jgi:Holliday junction DNA helicase RuvA
MVIIEANGVGYEIHISVHTYGRIGTEEQCKLHTYLNIREDAHVLFGFIDIEEKNLFLHLISVNGIGPGTARGILSSATPMEIKTAIVGEKIADIQRIKGIGAKTAQRLILELKDKLTKEGFEAGENIAGESNNNAAEALIALQALGYAKPQAEKALKTVLQELGSGATVEAMIRQALRKL